MQPARTPVVAGQQMVAGSSRQVEPEWRVGLSETSKRLLREREASSSRPPEVVARQTPAETTFAAQHDHGRGAGGSANRSSGSSRSISGAGVESSSSSNNSSRSVDGAEESDPGFVESLKQLSHRLLPAMLPDWATGDAKGHSVASPSGPVARDGRGLEDARAAVDARAAA